MELLSFTTIQQTTVKHGHVCSQNDKAYSFVQADLCIYCQAFLRNKRYSRNDAKQTDLKRRNARERNLRNYNNEEQNAYTPAHEFYLLPSHLL